MSFSTNFFNRGKSVRYRLPDKNLRVIPVVPYNDSNHQNSRLVAENRYFRLPFRSFYLSPIMCEDGYVNISFFSRSPRSTEK
ncbi:MAG: hypothetical protein ACOX5R_18550 [bacterium]|jgi:hypothetical protein